MALAALVGIVVGVGLAFFIEYLDTSVKTLDDVEKYLDIPVLAVIPKGVGQLIKLRGDTPDAEAYRILRANIEFNKPDRNANTFTLVSGGPGEGKSTTLNNLAFVCAQGGYNVLVVDADLRRPTQHRFFDQDNTVGLTDYLTGKAGLDEITKTTKIDNLSFHPERPLAGRCGRHSELAANGRWIAKLKRQYDLVFFDALHLGVSDGSCLRAKWTSPSWSFSTALPAGDAAAREAGGDSFWRHLIGVVLNNVDNRHDDGYSYYSSYNDYYAAPARSQSHAGSRAGCGAVCYRSSAHDGEDY
jgi:hypothetical protein